MFEASFIATLAIGAALGALFTGLEIPVLRKKQFGQFIREEGPKSHLSKEGTPTMGGIAIYAAIVAATLIGGIMSGKTGGETWVIVFTGLAYGLIGFFDDFIKVAAKHNLGLRAWQKLVLQIAVGVILGIFIMRTHEMGTSVWFPFINRYIDLGVLFVPFVAFVLVAMSNSVNLTDGLDGLCSGVTAIVSFTFAVIAMGFYQIGHTVRIETHDSIIYLMAMTGACIGFLFFNKYPAKIFMGDTGSMSLGGGLTAAVLMTRTELLIPIAGLIFVLEALSVIIQVVSFKSTGKRVFRMAPLHHHFEEGGMHEKKVVIMFYGIAAVCCIAALLISKI